MQRTQREYLQERIKRIDEMLSERSEYEPAGKGRFRYRSTPITNLEHTQERERALLIKLLQQVEGGMI